MPAAHLRRRTQPSCGLGATALALISLAAVLTLRGFPNVADDGRGSTFFHVLGTLFFFMPLALVAVELATAWPRAHTSRRTAQ